MSLREFMDDEVSAAALAEKVMLNIEEYVPTYCKREAERDIETALEEFVCELQEAAENAMDLEDAEADEESNGAAHEEVFSLILARLDMGDDPREAIRRAAKEYGCAAILPVGF